MNRDCFRDSELVIRLKISTHSQTFKVFFRRVVRVTVLYVHRAYEIVILRTMCVRSLFRTSVSFNSKYYAYGRFPLNFVCQRLVGIRRLDFTCSTWHWTKIKSDVSIISNLFQCTKIKIGNTGNVVELSGDHCCNGKATITSACIVEMFVTINNIKILRVAQNCFYGEFI
jgi:hypothetical protein